MWIIQHQVDIEEEGVWGLAAQVLNGFGAKGKVGDKVPVHNIQMDPSSARGRNFLEAFGKPGVSAGENGWCHDVWKWSDHGPGVTRY